MTDPLFEDLHADGLISETTLQQLHRKHTAALFSVHWELKTALYAGVLLLSTGLGILVYKHIDSIGHQAVVAGISLLCAGSFAWANRHKLPFTWVKDESAGPLTDYIVLLGTLSFLTLTAYLQVQYTLFGTYYGLATFIPMIVLFFVAYYFDHLGVLTLAIANLALWMGVTVTPKELLKKVDFDTWTVVYTYLALGLLLLTVAWLSVRLDRKKHFHFTYYHYGVHFAFIALLAGFFHITLAPGLLWLLALACLALTVYRQAFADRSFYFLLLTAVYGYIGLSGLVVRLFSLTHNEQFLSLLFLYFVCSAAGFIVLMIELNKRFKTR